MSTIVTQTFWLPINTRLQCTARIFQYNGTVRKRDRERDGNNTATPTAPAQTENFPKNEVAVHIKRSPVSLLPGSFLAQSTSQKQ